MNAYFTACFSKRNLAVTGSRQREPEMPGDCVMDFVKGLGDTTHTLEIAVDGLGRAEMYLDRLRITLLRASINPGGSVMNQPAVCLVWSTKAWRAIQSDYALLQKLVFEGHPLPPELDRLRAAHH